MGASDVCPPRAAGLDTKRQMQKRHSHHRVARVPHGSGICPERRSYGTQMPEPEHECRASDVWSHARRVSTPNVGCKSDTRTIALLVFLVVPAFALNGAATGRKCRNRNTSPSACLFSIEGVVSAQQTSTTIAIWYTIYQSSGYFGQRSTLLGPIPAGGGFRILAESARVQTAKACRQVVGAALKNEINTRNGPPARSGCRAR